MKREQPRDVPFRSLRAFLLISFGIAWGIVGLYIALPGPMTRTFGALTGSHPLFYVAVYAPAIAAMIVVVRHSGNIGLRRFIARALLWRGPWAWYALILIGIPLLYYAAAIVQGESFESPLAYFARSGALLTLLLMAIKGPVEEFGWRGLALPLLQRRLAPIHAALVLGLIWGIWHLPAFLLSSTPQGDWAFLPFLIGAVAVSVIVTAMFNQTRGSILLPALFHFQLINPIWPDAQPLDMYLFVGVAAVVVVTGRRSMFSGGGDVVTAVVTTHEHGGLQGGAPRATASAPEA